MNPVTLGDSIFVEFGTCSAGTGAATNAASTPVVSVMEAGSAIAYSPTVTNTAVGLYKAQVDCTTGNGFEAGRRYSLSAEATVGAITGRDSIGEFEVLANALNDVLDVAISTRIAPDYSGLRARHNRRI